MLTVRPARLDGRTSFHPPCCTIFSLIAKVSTSSARKSQTLRRFLHLKIEPYRYNDAADIERWRKLLKVFEDNLILGHKVRGALVGLERYLWNRTSGYMGALSDLIRAGANKAILTGKEQITEGLLDTILLDQGAEEDFARRQNIDGQKAT